MTLNEGGGFHPRNPGLRCGLLTASNHRSMKAGAFTPATPVMSQHNRGESSIPLNEGGGFHPRNPTSGVTFSEVGKRSMKAGAFTPATPVG